uniref:Myosin-1 n=1 Tax=Lygus hesperus TaxID=30085 RepID=A0A0A9ZE80_LYGHE
MFGGVHVQLLQSRRNVRVRWTKQDVGKLLSQIQTSGFEIHQEKLACMKEKLQMDGIAEERRICLEREKLELLQRRDDREMEFKERQLLMDEMKTKGDLRLKELEINNRFELEKIRIEKEMELKKMELQLKHGCKPT